MSKRKVKIIAVVVAVIITAVSLGAFGIAKTVTDGMFNMNTPMRITANSTVIGTIESKKDYESYIFEVGKNGALSVRLDHDDLLDSVKCGYRVTLYRVLEKETRTYKELVYFDSFWSDVTSSWGEIGVSPGTYLVMVYPGADIIYGDFTLVTSFTETTTFEKEPNDSKKTADTFKVDTAMYGSSSQRESGYDNDWFVFELTEDSCINLSFVHDDLTFPKAGWNIKILNEQEKVVCDFTSKLTDTLIKTGTIGLKKGTYYIEVESVSPIATTYTLVLSADKAVNNEFELNDTPETAIDLPQKITMSGSLSDRRLSLDKDYYRINVTQRGTLKITFSHEMLDGDKNGWNIRVLKKDGSKYYEVIKKISSWNSKTCIIENLGLSKGEYFILVDADSLSYNSATYKLKWNLTPRDDFETEPNNTIKRAKKIKGNKLYYGSIISTDVDFDEDYYKFELTEKTNVSLELGHEKLVDSSCTWTASIVDEDNYKICSVKSSLNQGLVSTGVVTLPAGTYYVKVSTGDYGSETPYYFRLVR